MTDTIVSPEIQVGSFVGLKRTHEDPDAAERLRGWIGAYGRGPFGVKWRRSEHVVLLDKNDKVIHFGSTGDPSFHIDYVEIWQE